MALRPGSGNKPKLPGNKTLLEQVARWRRDDPGTAPVKFCEAYCTHVKGPLAGQPLVLEPWQVEATVKFFGTMRPDGLRQYREMYVEVPRKNGKTTWMAAIGLYLLVAEQEAGAEIYIAAADRAQARICYTIMRHMIEASPSLLRLLQIYQFEIRYPAINGVLTALSSEAFSKHGLNASAVLFDEIHAQKKRDLWEAMTTSQGAREQPVLIAITTAGLWDPQSLGWELHTRAVMALEGRTDEPDYLPVLWGLDTDEPWDTEESWAKANPNLGVSVSLDFLRTEYRRAKLAPANENAFRRLYLNQWTAQETRWLSMDTWDANNGTPQVSRGDVCYAGLDLGSTTDLTSLVLVFPKEDGLHILPRFYIPRAKVTKGREDHVSYEAWAQAGLVQVAGEYQTDYTHIRRDLNELAGTYNIKEVGFDAWGSADLRAKLEEEDGFNMVSIPMTLAKLSGPTKDLERLLLAGRIHHGGHAVLRWNAANVSVYIDANENIRPVKNKGAGRIDGVVALILGLARAMANDYDQRSVYQSRGIRTL